MSVCKTELQELFSEDPEGWAKNLKMREALIRKLASGEGTIHLDTAEAITKAVNERTGLKKTVGELFELSKIKGYEVERTATYTYGVGRPVSDDEWIGYFRYIYEKRMRGNGLLITLGLSVIFGFMLLTYWYFTK